MSPEHWKAQYMEHLIKKGMTFEESKMVYDAGRDDHDYESDPVDAADEELSYWTE